MTLDDLSKELFKLPSGQAVGNHQKMFIQISSHPASRMRTRERVVSNSLEFTGARLNNNLALGDDSIWFVKD